MSIINIISSNCIGGRVYQQLNESYPNPFMWSSICLYDFVKLITLWDTINFSNIALDYTSSSRYGNDKCPYIRLDNTLNVYFSHHHFLESAIILRNESQEGDVDLYYNDMLSYLKNKWLTRLSRMSGNPIFVYDDMYVNDQLYTDIDISSFLSLKTPYQKILFTNDKNLVALDDNTLIFYKDKEHTDSRILGKILFDYLKKENQ